MIEQAEILRITRKIASDLARKWHLDRDDLIAEAYLAVFRKMPGYSPLKGAVSTYIYTVVNSKVKDIVRTRLRRETKTRITNTMDDVAYTVEEQDEIVETALGLVAQGLSVAQVRKQLRQTLTDRGMSQDQIDEQFATANLCRRPVVTTVFKEAE